MTGMAYVTSVHDHFKVSVSCNKHKTYNNNVLLQQQHYELKPRPTICKHKKLGTGLEKSLVWSFRTSRFSSEQGAKKVSFTYSLSFGQAEASIY